MGCNSSKQQVVDEKAIPKSSKVHPKAKKSLTEIAAIVTLPKNDEKSNALIYSYLTYGVNSIKVPSNLIPVLCLSENTIPVVVDNLVMSDGTTTNIQLPIIAVSFAARGRIVCFSHQSMVSSPYSDTSDFKRLMANICQWLCGKELFMLSALLLDLPSSLSNCLQSILLPLGLKADRGNFKSEFGSYPITFISSNIDLNNPRRIQILHKYISKGGSICCFFSPKDDDENESVADEPINEFLKIYGLSYSQCSLSVENEPRYEIEVAPKYEFVKNIRFPEISDLLANINSHQDRHGVSQTEHIDDIVTALRYYVMVSGENEVGIVSKLYDISFDYLKQTNYRVDDNICPLTTQEIIAVLLEVVSNKLPVDKMTVHQDIDLFPGLIENLQLGNHEVEVVLKHQQLLSTELWVAAGEIATIECSPHLNMGRQIGYQIGIHNTPLLTKRGPWHRWPTVITSFDLDKEVMQIASQFGGMLYLAVTDIPQDICGTVLKLKCQNVTPYTRFSTVDPNLFNSTKNSSVTWAEILSEKVIFTLRKEDMNRIPDIKKSIDFIDTLIIYMCDFMNTDIMRPIRIVFDVDDANEDNIEYYPITLEMEEIHRILCDQDEPSCELFDLIKKIANYSITDGYFDEQVEKAMAALIACEVFRRVYKDFDPYKASFFENPPIFQELWKIHTLINSNIVPEILKMANNVSTGTTEVPEDKWVDFLSKLCSIGNANFTKMFEKIRPVPINLNIEVSNLPIPEEIST